MKLTIIRLVNFTEQDHIDLAKVWPEYSPRRSTWTIRTASMRRGLMTDCWPPFA